MKNIFIFVEGEDDKSFIQKIIEKINKEEVLEYKIEIRDQKVTDIIVIEKHLFRIVDFDGVANLTTEKQFFRIADSEIGTLPNLSESTIAIVCDSDLCHNTRKTEIEKILKSAWEKYKCQTAFYLLPLQSSQENGQLEDLVLKIAEEIDQLKILKQKSKEFADGIENYKNPKLSSSIIAFRSMLAAKADKNDPVNKIHHAIKANKGIGCILTEEFFTHNLLNDLKKFLKNLSN